MLSYENTKDTLPIPRSFAHRIPMTATEHLLVLVSIIVGLALTDILTSVHRLVHARKRVRFNWFPVGWAVVLFYITVQVWWASLHGVQEPIYQNFFAFALYLLVPVTLYLGASSVLPDVESEGVVDMQAHYFEHRTWLFLVAALTISMIVATDVLQGDPFLGPPRAIHGVLLATFVALAWTKNRRIHALGLTLSLALIVAFIVLYSLELG